MRLSTRAIVPAALAAVLLLAVTNSLLSDLSAAPTDPDVNVAEPPSSESREVAPLDDSTPTTVRETPLAGTLVSQYLDDRFGPGETESAWHANIRSIAVRFGTVIVQSDLSDDPGDSSKAAAICQAVLGFQATAWVQQMDGLVVEVYGQSGRLLAQDRSRPSTLGRAAPQQQP